MKNKTTDWTSSSDQIRCSWPWRHRHNVTQPSGTVSGTVSGAVSGTVSGAVSGTDSGTVSGTVSGLFFRRVTAFRPKDTFVAWSPCRLSFVARQIITLAVVICANVIR